MRRRRTNALGPGGRIIVGGIVGVAVLFLLWQFVLPFFTSRTDNNVSNNTTQNPVETTKKPVMTGQIVDAITGNAIPGATILAGTNKLADVDATGTFTITQTLPQDSAISVLAPGYIAAPLPGKQAASVAIQLQPNVLNGQLLDADTGKPIAGKLITFNKGGTTTDTEGRFSMQRVTDKDKINVELIGYEKVQKAVDLPNLSSVMTISIRSTRLDGTITDSDTGKGIPNALVSINSVGATTDFNGKYYINDAPRGSGVQVKVRAPGYKVQSFPIETAVQGIKMAPFKFQGVYVRGTLALNPNYNKLFTPFLDLAKQGKINAIVVDIKDDDTGKLLYDSKVPMVNDLKLVYNANGLSRNELIPVKRMLEESHKAGLYVVARMVVYRDPALATAKPEWSLKNRNTGQPWKDVSGLVWPSPFVPEVAEYNAQIAQEAASLGFDEVQYDYIRFPTDGKLSDIDYGGGLNWKVLGDPKNEKMRTEPIERTVKKAYDVLHGTDTFLSIDVFGYSLWLQDDVQIGQQYNNLIFMTDYICPMVYATHFEQGTLDQAKYPGPTGKYPGVIIDQSGIKAVQLETKLKGVAKYRPWLEDFSLPPVKHTPERVTLQITAANNGGASGWTLWNVAGDYTENVLPQVKKS